MRLLSRPEASVQSSQQRKEQADSGMYLAGRVDRLRETLLQLESQQKQFIDGNKRAIDEALAEGHARKSRMEGDIFLLEARMAELRKPLDAEWNQVEEQRDELVSMMASEAQKCLVLDAKEVKLDNLISEASKERGEAVYEKEKAQGARAESQKLLEAIKTRHFDQEKAFADGRNAIIRRIDELEKEKIRLEYDRKHFRDFEKELRRKENDLALRETRVGIKERKYANRQQQQDSGDGVRPGNG